MKTFLNLDSLLSKTKIVGIGIVLLLLAFGSGYIKGCSDKKAKIEKQAEQIIIIKQEQAAEKKTIRESKNQKILENTKRLKGSEKDAYQSCIFSTNPLLQECPSSS